MSSANQQGWYSIVGYLYMKPNGGAFSLLKPRKRMYFALEETDSCLVFFKDEVDFMRRKEPLGTIPLAKAACTIVDTSPTAFAIHADGRKYSFDAENDSSAERWMNALQNRRESVDLNENIRTSSRSTSRAAGITRSRTTSLPSESDLQSGSIHHCIDKHVLALDEYPHLNSYSRRRRALRRLQSIDIPTNERTSIDEHSRKETIEKKGFQKEGLPAVLDEWITNWLNEQPFMEREGDESMPDNSQDETIVDDGASSGSTSTCDQRHSSSSSSGDDGVLFDELNRLRAINNRQKEKIQELNEEKKRLTVEISQLAEFQRASAERINDNYKASLSTQNKFLNAEVLRLSERNDVEQKTISKLRQEKARLEEDLNSFRREYVFLLQSCIQIPLSDTHSVDVVQVKLLGGDVHKKRVLRLLEEERVVDPTLPSFESLTVLGNYVDMHGFRHSFDDEGLALHYICTLLHTHYRDKSQTQIGHRTAWIEHLRKCSHLLLNTRETRRLVRAGVPNEIRTTVWKLLIHQQVADIKKLNGKYYYRNLCNSHGSAAERQYNAIHQKQITLDLLRTMPSNVHFMSPCCKGIQQLEQVLRAYCLHNPTIGYCQGMNFIASTAMLFVGAEDTFWFLVAITEKYFDKSYFDQSLTGAQADQEVLKELLDSRLPRLSAHLDACDIDLATVTLNWFIALFFDTVPFQTMIRIWDCFLLEGPKVLFRFAVALLSIHENEVLQRTDTISVMKILKASVRLTYDHEGLFNLAFDNNQPFPSRDQIEQKQKSYLTILQERLSRRRQLRGNLTVSQSSSVSNNPAMEVVAFCDTQDDLGFICSGNQTKGIISRLDFSGTATSLRKLNIEFECRIISMSIPNDNIAFISLLSGYIVALHWKENNFETLWELKLSDVALKLLHFEGRLYAALANGTLTVIEKVTELVPSELELYHLPIGAAPITDVAVVDDALWLAVACKVVVISITCLTTLKRIYVASAATGSAVPLFEKIRCMNASPHGVWIVTAHSTLVQLWRDSDCRLLFDVSFDHSHKKPSLSDLDDKQEMEITTILYVRDQIWIGTTDGYLIIYHVRGFNNNEEPSDTTKVVANKYPAGRRLSPHSGSVHESQGLASYYIPTESETKHDESASSAEYPCNGRARKVSLFIDFNTRKYSAVRKGSGDSAIDTATHLSTCGAPSTEFGRLSVDVGLCNQQRDSPLSSARRRTLMRSSQGISADSAVSVFSSDENNDNAPLANVMPRRGSFYSPGVVEKESAGPSLLRCATAPSQQRRPPRVPHTLCPSSLSSNPSMEYDDLFEVYSEADDVRPTYHHSTAPSTSQQPLQNHFEIPVPTTSAGGEHTVGSVGSCPTIVSPSGSTSSKHDANAWRTFSDLSVRLRRRDLDFDEMLKGMEPLDDIPVQHSSDISSVNSDATGKAEASNVGITLVLDMKIKISDKPVKCARPTSINDETVVITCAGDYGDMESVLKWTVDRKNTVGDELWINDPVVDPQYRRVRTFHDSYPI